MAIVHYPGEIKSMRWSASAKGADRPGMVIKVEDTTATSPRACLVTASGDLPQGVMVADTYNQAGTLQSGSSTYASYVQEGEVLVSVEAGTFHPGEIIWVADTSDGYGRAEPTGSCVIGICNEYRVVATGDYTNKRYQVRVKLCLEGNPVLKA